MSQNSCYTVDRFYFARMLWHKVQNERYGLETACDQIVQYGLSAKEIAAVVKIYDQQCDRWNEQRNKERSNPS